MKKLFAILLSIVLAVSIPTAAQATQAKQVGQVNVSYGTLNVRKNNSTSSAIVNSLSKDSYITLLNRSGSWWQVEYAQGAYGYCHADYISALGGKSVFVSINSGTLNVRSGASKSFDVTGSLNKGENVLVLATYGQWSRILYQGTKTGYVGSLYLSTAAASSSVSLSVPSYKQTDSRWANVTLGSSGKTIARVGCATTGIAMMESYRTGQTLTPDVMAKRLSYTSSGNVYWPGHYKTTTTYNLNNILALLQQGKPVLLGAKNAYGTQHWVVITGFNGSNLTAANFSIHDPGSNTRVNLQQFLSAYPTFYKYFSY